MATATPQGNMNIENYDEALRLFEEEMYDEAIAAAQHNLGDLSLHWYWQVMNLIFIAQVEDKWNSAELHRVAAEDIWEEVSFQTPKAGDDSQTPEADERDRELLEMLLAELHRIYEHQKSELLPEHRVEEEPDVDANVLRGRQIKTTSGVDLRNLSDKPDQIIAVYRSLQTRRVPRVVNAGHTLTQETRPSKGEAEAEANADNMASNDATLSDPKCAFLEFIGNLASCATDLVKMSRQGRVAAAMEDNVLDLTRQGYGEVVRLGDALKGQNMSNDSHTVHDIHDILKSYYKVTRKTFVDNVCKQATDHFLLAGPDSPLYLFSPVFVSRLSTTELENIAGELPGTKRIRAQLGKEIASLTEAKKILART